MAKKKQPSTSSHPPKRRGRTKPRGFSPSGPHAIEGMARSLASGRGKAHRSALALAQEIADAAWEAAQPQDQVALAERALSLSPDCADAYVILANQAPSRQTARRLLEEGVAAGARAIGVEAFEAVAGRFWLDQRTRPYMRARLGLAQCLWESGQRAEAATHFAELLRLNPNDNQGVRYMLLGALVELDRDAEAQRLLQRYDNDASAEWAYTSALLAFRREGDSPLSRDLLRTAVGINQFAPEFLVGNKNMPPMPPTYVSPGGEDEAVSYAAQFLRTWRSSPGAIPWLRKTLKVPLPHPPKTRKPAWSLFRHAFLRLPKVKGEVWQLDVCRLPSPSGDERPARDRRSPWALVLWNRNDDMILAFEAGDQQPTIGEAWEAIIEAMLRPRIGEPHRPAEIQVRRTTFYKTWRDKLRQIDVACGLHATLNGLNSVLQTLVPATNGVRRFLETPDNPTTLDLDDLAALPQNAGEVWQVGVRRLPGWLEQEGELRRPWALLVAGRDEHAVLTQNLSVDPPRQEWVWENVADAMLRPMMGTPHRPGIIEVANDDHQRDLQERLEALDVRCVLADGLEQIDEIFQQLGKLLARGRAARPLVDVPGVRLEDICSFYSAAAAFYRAAPWQLVPGDTTLKIEYSKFQTHTWYAVVMGQSGLVLGLALYEDLNMLRRLFSAGNGGSRPDEDRSSRQATGLSVMFGEAFEVPIADFDASQLHGWEVAGEEAYPNPIYVNPGRSMRPPLAWELELLEASLRAVPRFLQSGDSQGSYDVTCARDQLTLQISQVANGDE